MQRPTRLFCHRLARDRHLDVDTVLAWPMSKIREYMAFYMTENPDWQKEYEEDNMSDETKALAIAKMVGAK